MKKILILLANPQEKNTPPLELDRELHQVEQALERTINHQSFEITIRWAARVEDLRRELLHSKPQIVHFSGHGSGNYGLILETESRQKQFVSSEALAGLFELCKDYVECVLLNACYSEEQAIAIHRHIDYVIGMNQAILDTAAIQFAIGFYDALAAGRSYEDAYRLGCNAIALEGIKNSAGESEALTPVLKKRRWIVNEKTVLEKTSLPEFVETDKLKPQPEVKSSLPQSITISGGTISGQVGQAGGNLSQTQQIYHSQAEKQLNVIEVVELISQIETLVKQSTIPEERKSKAIAHLAAVKEAATEEEPDKDYAAKSLQKATKFLKESSATIESAKKLWQQITSILTQLLPWLGVAPNFFGL
ncbi:CHAT domain-containing protein [Nostoc sp. DedQUE09]|uniref:CHAT domain-containing protein n=1 Tax=Nostoc sp. DedQUE09 TaxID=3075394 RepID=UPI002AD21615|nr:CHAT domain-containing protein [Nostoc sp. DedQUE09]MDZ7955381.1 CHAT domain-containing protein [Nostoc sp. DedQUE09]